MSKAGLLSCEAAAKLITLANIGTWCSASEDLHLAIRLSTERALVALGVMADAAEQVQEDAGRGDDPDRLRLCLE